MARKILYPQIEKTCPVCNKSFKTGQNAPKEKTTCSHACSNTFFRTGENHPNWKEDAYRSTCFYYHKKECIICKEDKIVEVHHLDENRYNNKPSNLVPLCPTHHQYWHSKFKSEIETKVLEYIKNFTLST